MWQYLIRNHVLVNLSFLLVLAMGTMSYVELPRQRDPSINFNWIQLTTFLPGASAGDVERRVTDPLEEAIRKVSDIRFVSSSSREGLSSILVRFNELHPAVFDKRLTDLRREVQNKADEELPEEAEDPIVFEVTTANAFPSAMLLVTAPAEDENLRRQARNVKKDLERLAGVDQVLDLALYDPELQVEFLPERMEALGVNPTRLADTIAAHFRDVAAGGPVLGGQRWLLRLIGKHRDPGYLAGLPIAGVEGEVRIGEVADVVRGRERATTAVRYRGRPAVLLTITKKARANTLDLVERVQAYIEERNRLRARTGAELVLLDDRTQSTRQAIGTMQNNALIGLTLVLAVTWAFLGSRIALITTVGIPFILSGTFLSLFVLSETLNNSVLLGVVIVLGMLVDDAVVVVEAIYQRLLAGMEALPATIEAVREVAAPVVTAVLTTMAAFLPLMLLPGLLGQFMRVIPMVVTLSLAISLIEAFWMLPAHVLTFHGGFSRPSRVQRLRRRLTHWVQIGYIRLLVRVLRRPRRSLALVGLLFAAALGVVAAGLIRIDFFASDTLRLFYVNVEMPPGTALRNTLEVVTRVEARVRTHLPPGETRALTSYAGQMFTETEPLYGENLGQVFISLQPRRDGVRDVGAIIDAMRADVRAVPGPRSVTFLTLNDGPPISKPVKVKVRGDRFPEIREAADALKATLRGIPGVRDIQDDAHQGGMELALKIDPDALRRSGIDPVTVARTLRMLADGEIAGSLQDEGEEVEVRVLARPGSLVTLDQFLERTLALPEGGSITLDELLTQETRPARDNIRHYNYRRAITVEAELDQEVIDTVTANRRLRDEWRAIADRHPDIDLDFSGELDDIQESLDAMPMLFLLGLGLMYLILGTQFRSYFQPLMILATIPLAFTGVVLGLLITGNPLSLYTLYGMVALAGIAVNAAIVLISAANQRLRSGLRPLHSTVYAARRRVIPILITTLTTIAGLLSLATGLGGQSLIWGPVATAIVWGLGFSSLLTLFVIPLLYRLSMGR